MLPTTVSEKLLKLETLENQIRNLKTMEAEFETLKSELYDLMVEYEADNYTTLGGLKFTRIKPTEEKTEIVIKFNEDKFKLEHPKMYVQYVTSEEKVTKGRKGYLRMSIEKEDK